MSGKEEFRGHAVVMQPGDGPSFWQPKPANGHADPMLIPENPRFDDVSMGYQTIAVGGHVREHSHADQVELQICFKGKGHVMVDGESHDEQGVRGYSGYPGLPGGIRGTHPHVFTPPPLHPMAMGACMPWRGGGPSNPTICGCPLIP